MHSLTVQWSRLGVGVGLSGRSLYNFPTSPLWRSGKKMVDRNLSAYQKEYIENLGFEKYQVNFRRNKILETMQERKPKFILEVGCGIESIAQHYTNYERFVVVEPIEEFVRTASRSVEKSNAVFINKKIEDAYEDLKGEHFDFIIISSLLHELEKPVEILKIIRSLCAGETVVHVNTPNVQSIHKLLGVKMGLIKNSKEPSELSKKFQRHGEYDISDLCSLVDKSGFEVIDKGSYFIKPMDHSTMQALVAEGKISEAYLEALYKLTRFLPENGSEIFVNLKIKN